MRSLTVVLASAVLAAAGCAGSPRQPPAVTPSSRAAVRPACDTVASVAAEPTVRADSLDPGFRRLSLPPLHYPETLRQAGISGYVDVELVVDTAGRADRCTLRVVSATHPLFVRAATDVVLGARWTTPTRNGVPVRARARQRVSFLMQQEDAAD